MAVSALGSEKSSRGREILRIRVRGVDAEIRRMSDTAPTRITNMTSQPSILCPVDFSEASGAALRQAHAIASHFVARIVLLAVEDPLVAEPGDLHPASPCDLEPTRRELTRFAERVLEGANGVLAGLDYCVAVGQPANEILRVATEFKCDLIVMSTHGRSGFRKLFFGATTERVLRETTLPVLVVPPGAATPWRDDDMGRGIGRILVPVDLTAASLRQTQMARAIATALRVPLIVAHVLEPLRGSVLPNCHQPGLGMERRTHAENALGELVATVPRRTHPEALVVYGDPAEEIAKLARDRRIGLIVIGLHASPRSGPGMGSVTYRVLCLTSSLVLALPPTREALDFSAAAARLENRYRPENVLHGDS